MRDSEGSAARNGGLFGGLAARQAVATLLIALAFGLLVGLGELFLDWRATRKDISENMQRILALAQPSASEAAYLLNERLARRVASGLARYGAIGEVALFDEGGATLAREAGDHSPAAAGSLAALLFGDLTEYQIALSHEERPVGRLVVRLSPDAMAQGFFERVSFLAMGSVARALAISALVVLVFYGMVIRPLTRLAKEVDAIDPAHPAARPLTVDVSHERNEIGLLVKALNRLMDAFQRNLVENRRMGAELDVSRKLQRMILPTPDELKDIPGLDVATYMESANEVGGDYYDILRDRDRLRIGIGDVTGHGLESGVVMLMTQSAVRTLTSPAQGELSHALCVLNRTIHENVRRMGSDKNLTLALIDYHQEPTGGRLRIGGQHESVIVVRRDGALELIDTLNLGMPLGLIDEVAGYCAEAEVRLLPGDVVVLYTDGITEAADARHRLYGLERLCECVVAARGASAEAIKEAVVADVKAHIGAQTIYDDLTLIVLKQKECAA